MLYTTRLTTQNTNVYVCNIVRRRNECNDWFATCTASGTFGTGTVTFSISFDNGATLIPLTQDGTNSPATLTAAGAVNVRCGDSNNNNNQPKLYASIATATTPALDIIVADNR